MELMNRELQLTLLQQLAAAYPEELDPRQLGMSNDDRAWNFNAMYLHQHGLIHARWTDMLSRGRQIHLAGITAKGLDFLQDDGGLGAILGTVTVRFEAETLQALLAAKVQASALPPEKKSKVLGALKQLGADALKEVSKRLLDAALDQAPDVLQQLPQMLDL
ncbi:hypothetical protein [uncultured Azohydromonas sp.]|jgi:hypothetical protein|uniref:hypothetical protein n=1 Tax=uncultured Azohydromonas sp. TaxID=487342 RepID=UPI00262ABFCC|nr:hypothetical protein [uncultured Azohydromonas sp.]